MASLRLRAVAPRRASSLVPSLACHARFTSSPARAPPANPLQPTLAPAYGDRVNRYSCVALVRAFPPSAVPGQLTENDPVQAPHHVGPDPGVRSFPLGVVPCLLLETDRPSSPGPCSASQAMLYATDGIDEPNDLDKPMVGVANVWCAFPDLLSMVQLADSRVAPPRAPYRYEGNPCVVLHCHPLRYLTPPHIAEHPPLSAQLQQARPAPRRTHQGLAHQRRHHGLRLRHRRRVGRHLDGHVRHELLAPEPRPHCRPGRDSRGWALARWHGHDPGTSLPSWLWSARPRLTRSPAGVRQEHVRRACRGAQELAGADIFVPASRRPGVLMALGRLNRPGIMGASWPITPLASKVAR